jgi:hypothetical protein
MSDQLKMSYQPTLTGLLDAISLPASPLGNTPSVALDGLTSDGSGQAHVRASLSARQAKEKGLLTSGTYGLRGSTLSRSADLTHSLANRYRVLTEQLGSTLFTLTWKESATASGRLIFRLRASGRRTDDSDCISWPTPASMDTGLTTDLDKIAARRKAALEKNKGKTGNGFGLSLGEAARFVHWEKTPHASDGEGGVMEIRPEANGHYKLRDLAQLAEPWITPQTHDTTTRGNTDADNHYSPHDLSNQARMANWASPSARDWKDTPGMSETGTNPDGTERTRLDQLPLQASLTASGETQNGSTVATVNTGQLSPAFSLWLMGFPAEWASSGARGMLFVRSKRKSSSKVT